MTGYELDPSVRQELRTLSKENAKGVAQHLVMVGRLLEVDLAQARRHAETAVRRAGRVAAAREARGLVAYREGDYQAALAEFRTARRVSGSHHLLPLMVDCERALGRPEHALELAGSPEARTLAKAERIELLIVCSGIRRDMGDLDAAVVLLETPDLDPARREPWSARLFYAYADVLATRGDRELSRAWFAAAAQADVDGATDAAERLDEIDGVVFTDLGEADEESEGPEQGDAAEDPAAVAPVDTPSTADAEEDRPEPAQASAEPPDAEASGLPEREAGGPPDEAVDHAGAGAAPEPGETPTETT